MEFEKRLKPLCMQLITKAANCSSSCAYRHNINFDDNYLPKSGDIKLRLLDVLAPNRYSMHITHYRKSEMGTWLEFPNQDKWDHFNEQLNRFYNDVNNLMKHQHCHPGDMCAVIVENEVFRGRVMEKLNQTVKVLLIDIGKMEKYHSNAVLKLDEHFCDFPAQTIEAILLGIEPNDFNMWKTDARRCVIEWTKNDRNKMFAKVVNSFERTLLIKSLEIHQIESKIKIGDNLVTHGYAAKRSINLHPVFGNIEPYYESHFIGAQSISSERLSIAHPSTSANLSNLITLHYGVKLPNKQSKVFENVEPNHNVSLDNVQSNSSRSFSSANIHESRSITLEPEKEDVLVNFMSKNNSNSSHSDAVEQPAIDIDAIFNITPDNQAMKPLVPLKANKEENLIDLDDFASTSNFNIPSPFNNYRVIESIDDLI